MFGSFNNNMLATAAAFVRPELTALIYQYRLVTDCIAGSQAVKRRRELYLPVPGTMDAREVRNRRYEGYLRRAMFLNVVKRTVQGMVGQIFLRDPQIKLPAGINVLQLDADGKGGTLRQLMENACRYALAFGRAGILTTFPVSTQPTTVVDLRTGVEGTVQLPSISQAEIDEGDVRPTMEVFKSQDIINWQQGLRGGRKVYTLIVLQQNNFRMGSDGFKITSENAYYVLRLLTKQQALQDIANNGRFNDLGIDYNLMLMDGAINSDTTDVFKMEVYRQAAQSRQILIYHYYPTAHDGTFLNEIPFRFVGVDENDATPVEPPVYDLAEVNIAHYRNSADNEESIYIHGQATLVIAGLSEQWADKYFKDGVGIGSRGAIPLPVGGDAEMLQVGPNTLSKQGMDDKERMMIALGAKLIEQRSVQRTATEAEIENAADSSILGSIARNVASAFVLACKDACKFTGDDPASTDIKLNTEFDLQKMDAQERFQLLTEYLNGGITWDEYRSNLKRGGVAYEDNTKALTIIEAEMTARAKLTAAIAPPPPIPGGNVTVPVPPAKAGGGKAPSQSQ